MAELMWKITKITGCDNQITLKTEGGEELEPNVEYSWPTIQASIDAVTDTCKKDIIVYLSASTNDTATLNIVRSCGSTPPPVVDCENPQNDEGLNSIIAMILTGEDHYPLGVDVTYENTPCTYTYLKFGYDYLTGGTTSNNQEKAWFIANMFSELTPYKKLASKYFSNAVKNDGGGCDMNTTEGVRFYENRIDGASDYAQFKHKYKDESFLMANNARIELHGSQFNVREAVYRTGVDFSTIGESVEAIELKLGTQICTNLDVYEYVENGFHSLPINTPSYEGDSYDFNKTMSLVTANDTKDVPAVKDYHGETGYYQPLSDKSHKAEYFASIFGVSENDNTDLINKILDYTGESQSEALKQYYWRLRPNCVLDSHNADAQCCNDTESHYNKSTGLYGYYMVPKHKPDSDTNFPYSCESNAQGCTAGTCYEIMKYADSYGIKKGCSNCIYSIMPITSYPSGHALMGLLSGLALIQKYGNEMQGTYTNSRIQRAEDYSFNRAVVRAHWPTDVVAGKLYAGMQIGFLNGFETYNTLINGGTPPTPPAGDCKCTAFGRFILNDNPKQDANLYAGFAPKAGYDDGKPHVIGYYKATGGTCSLPTGLEPYSHGGDMPVKDLTAMWDGVSIWFTDEPQKDENGVDIKLYDYYSHYIMASKIPANNYTTTSVLIMHFKPNNGCTDKFTINQNYQ